MKKLGKRIPLQNCRDPLLNPLHRKIVEKNNTNVDLIVTASLEVYPVKTNKETCEEKIDASIKSEETLTSTGIREKNLDKVIETYLQANRSCS